MILPRDMNGKIRLGRIDWKWIKFQFKYQTGWRYRFWRWRLFGDPVLSEAGFRKLRGMKD